MTNFIGTTGDDSQLGTSGADHFDFSQGGHDTIDGGGGGDVYVFGGALDAGDEIVGSASGYDLVQLDGDYSHGLTLSMDRFSDVDEIDLQGTAAYRLTLTGAMISSSGTLFVISQTDGEARIDVSGLTGVASVHAEFNSLGTHGSFIGGAGDDVIDVSHQIGRDERFDGGAGADSLAVFASQDGFRARDDTIRNIETLYIFGAVKLADGNVAAGQVMTVTGAMSSIDFDGHKETDGAYDVTGSADSDTLIGGRGADTLTAAFGADTLIGGKGADLLTGGGDANDAFVYRALSDSTRTAFDTITDLGSGDVIDLSHVDANSTKAGNQGFTLVDHFSHHAGELTMTYMLDGDYTVIGGDVDGDGKADLVIRATGDVTGFAEFVL